LTEEPDVTQAAAAAFRALQARARAEHAGNTQPLLVVYAVESFLRRLALSDYAGQMMLKGGMLMAATGIRTMTKDADLATRGLPNDELHVRAVVREICALTPDPHDGVHVDPATVRAETTRDDADYSGVRCKLVAALGRARVPFALDFSFGDPGAATVIKLESVIDQPTISLLAYPLALNLAEKIVTAMQRRATNTRDRDFADLWVTSRRHRLDAHELKRSIEAMVDRMSYLATPPATWIELVDGVITFVDPLLRDAGERFSAWDPEQLRWQ